MTARGGKESPRGRRMMRDNSPRAAWRDRLYTIIFEADTRAGRLFDVALLVAILLSIAAISVETIRWARETREIVIWLDVIEWCFTLLFSLEYALRLICVHSRRKYAFSFYGIVDVVSILPTYLSIFFPVTSSFAVIRSLRLLRVFRVLKLVHIIGEAEVLYSAIWNARGKVVVFLATVLITVTIIGTMMFAVEGHLEDSGFTSIPDSIYWAVITMTTVGYGDIVPTTIAGKVLAAALILIGYSLIIVPTGFVSAELANRRSRAMIARVCGHCLVEGHEGDAVFCRLCGNPLARKADSQTTSQESRPMNE